MAPSKPSVIKRDDNMSPAYFASASVLTSGTKLSTTPGTPVALVASSIPCHHVAIYAYIGNSSNVAVGDQTNTLAEPATNNKTGKGELLVQGASTICYVVDASLIYIDVATSGDGVTYTIYA